LADYKVPAYVFWFEKFPMNASGKIELKELRKEAAERAAKQRETAGGTQE
jgi:fatty-acyl-CoA synthase